MAGQGEARNVVIAMDGSEHAKNAMNWYVSDLSQPNDSVIMVYVVDLYDTTNNPLLYSFGTSSFDPKAAATFLTETKTKAQQKLQEFADMMSKAKIKGTVKQVEANNPGEGLMRVAEEYNAKLIVSGCRGLGKIRRILLGSTSEYLLNHSKVPVAVCRWDKD